MWVVIFEVDTFNGGLLKCDQLCAEKIIEVLRKCYHVGFRSQTIDASLIWGFEITEPILKLNLLHS